MIKFIVTSIICILSFVYPSFGQTTWNASDAGTGITLSSGNLIETVGSTAWYSVRATTSKNTGKYYFEEHVIANTSTGSPYNMAGVASGTASVLNSYLGSASLSLGLQSSGAAYGSGFTVTGTMPVYGVSDKIGLAIDFDAGKLWVSKNNTWLSSGNPAAGTNPFATFTPNTAFFPAASSGAAGNSLKIVASSFTYTPPSGFSSWDPPPPPTAVVASCENPIASGVISSSVPNLVLVNTTGVNYRFSRLLLANVASSRELIPAADSVLTMYYSFNGGVSFDKSANYLNNGIRLWPNHTAPWPPTYPSPLWGNMIDPMAAPATPLNGNILSGDTGDTTGNGTSGTVDIFAGATAYSNVNYSASTMKGENGSYHGVYITIPFWMAGSYNGAPGQIPNAIMIEASGNSMSWPLIQGVVIWCAVAR